MPSSDEPRAPLGLPPGSVRGILAIVSVIQLWLLLLLPDERAIPIPLNLYFLLALVLIFFVAHGKSMETSKSNEPSPLWLPRGSIRFLIIVGTIATSVFLALYHPERFDRLIPKVDNPNEWQYWKYLVGAVFGGLVLGQLVKLFPFRDSYVLQTFQAWCSLIAMATMFVEVILQTMVKSTLVQQFDFGGWEVAVTAVVAFYYGVRT